MGYSQIFEILHPCFRYNGKFFKNANFRPFPISNGNKTLFLKKSQFHFKRSRRFPNFGFFHYKRNKRLFENTFPIFRTCCCAIYFFCKKEKSHSQSGVTDCPWSFPVCYDMCVFALCFRLKWELTNCLSNLTPRQSPFQYRDAYIYYQTAPTPLPDMHWRGLLLRLRRLP